MIKNLNPVESWQLMQQNPNAIMIDTRTKMEYGFVGHPVSAIHVPWKEFPDWQVNPDFVDEVERIVSDKKTPILLLCRSGQRSLEAAAALEEAGFEELVNILEGFEGPLDENKHRGKKAGWRFHGLPWEQS